MYTLNNKRRGFVFRITVIFSKFSYSCRRSLKAVAVFEENRWQKLEMRRFSALVFSSCLALSLCSVQSVPSLTTRSDSVVNRTENCQKYTTYEDCVKKRLCWLENAGDNQITHSSRLTITKFAMSMKNS